MNDPVSPSAPPRCSDSTSCTAALVIGIIALVLAVIGFFPCLGWFALVPAILLAIIALVMSILGVAKGAPKSALVVSIIALVLSMGAGIVQAWMASTAVVCMEKHQKCVEKTAQDMQKEFQQSLEQQRQERLKTLPEMAPAGPAEEGNPASL